MRELLKQHWDPSTAAAERAPVKGPRRSPAYALGSLVSLFVAAHPTKKLSKLTGAKPPLTIFFRFGDPEEASEFAQFPGRRSSRNHPELQFLNGDYKGA